MTESTPDSPPNSSTSILPSNPEDSAAAIPDIPIEIVSEEEMALIEAAFAATRSYLSSSSLPSVSLPSSSASLLSSRFRSNVRSIQSITHLSKRTLDCSSQSRLDIEDSGDLGSSQKKSRVVKSFLHRFRRKRGLFVTDITSTEWCEKRMEFILLFGKRKINKAMKAGHARHMKLEEEVVKKVQVNVEVVEDKWAVKFINFITGANQLIFEGLTRELQLIGFVEGVWMVGIIDEVRMSGQDTDRKAMLVDTKTRVRNMLPAEPQRRNGRLQLMCYKHLWDTLVADSFPSGSFFDFFSLNRYCTLSEDIRKRTSNLGFPAQTLDDVVRYYRNTFSMLPSAQDQLLLRYELQKDQSVLGEDQFAHDSDWVKDQIQSCLGFWSGEREASYTPEEERWKCRHCEYASVCPGNPGPNNDSMPGSTSSDSDTSSS